MCGIGRWWWTGGEAEPNPSRYYGVMMVFSTFKNLTFIYLCIRSCGVVGGQFLGVSPLLPP